MDFETKTPNQPAQPDQPITPPTSAGPPQTPAGLAFGRPTPPPPPPPPPSTLETVANGFRSLMGAVFSWIIFPIAVVLILHNFVFQAYHVLGKSMVPTLQETDYLIISKVGNTATLIKRALGQNAAYIPERGEIIVFHYPKNPSQVFVKRVIGVPGDRIVIKNGQVTVYNKANPNGFNPDTKYEPKDSATLIDTDEVVQDGNVFVLGDNRAPGGSYDSREWGELPSSYIVGNAVLRLLPLDQVRIF
jgi:signal peptidase I